MINSHPIFLEILENINIFQEYDGSEESKDFSPQEFSDLINSDNIIYQEMIENILIDLRFGKGKNDPRISHLRDKWISYLEGIIPISFEIPIE